MATATRSTNRSPGPGTSAGETAVLGGLGTVLGLGMLLLLGGAAASWAFGGGWVWPPVARLAPTALSILAHAGRPAEGYPTDLASDVAGPVPFWAVVGVLTAVMVFAVSVAGIGLATRGDSAGYATRQALAEHLGAKPLRRAASELRPGGLVPRAPARAATAISSAEADRSNILGNQK